MLEEVSNLKKNQEIDPQDLSDIDDIELGDSPTKSTGSSADTNSWMDFTFKWKEMKTSLKRLMVLNKIKNVNVDDTLHEKFDTVSAQRQNEIMNGAGAAIASVLHTLYAFRNSSGKLDDGYLWKKIKESKFVDKFLETAAPPDYLLSEVIRAYNATTDRKLRIQILSLLANEYTYATLAQFNPKNYKDTSSVKRSERLEEEGEKLEMESEVSTESVPEIKVQDNLTFLYPVSRYIYRKARDHYRRHKHALARIPDTKITRWHWSLELVRSIVEFVSDPLNTQQVAYGTLAARDAHGQLTRVARVIRLHQKSVLVGLIQQYLRDRGFEKIPSRTSIFRILSRMPAASISALRGVDTTTELAMRSFQKLHEILDSLKDTRGGIEKEEYESLKKCIDSSKLYLKSSYYRNLSMHSPIASHCVSRACSSKEEEFKQTCPSDHTETCEHCMNIRDLFRSFLGLLKKKRPDFDDDFNYVESEHEVNLANERVMAYQNHILRTWIQNAKWNDLLYNLKPGVAMVTSDWAMKKEPEWYREMNAEWYGKKGECLHFIISLPFVCCSAHFTQFLQS